MQKKVEKMIVSLLPDAVPGVDFKVEILPDETAEITHWDTSKLGTFPGLKRLREMYLRFADRRKRLMPSFDNSDPLPYLAEKPKETVRRTFNITNVPTVEVINGVAFSKK